MNPPAFPADSPVESVGKKYEAETVTKLRDPIGFVQS